MVLVNSLLRMKEIIRGRHPLNENTETFIIRLNRQVFPLYKTTEMRKKPFFYPSEEPNGYRLLSDEYELTTRLDGIDLIDGAGIPNRHFQPI